MSRLCRIVVVMGVTGSGKTTIGRALAARLQWRFVEGDDYHPPGNKALLARGDPLSDDDRRPWLNALRTVVADAIEKDEHIVLACSALKAAYRDALVPAGTAPGTLRFVYLRGDPELLHARLEHRAGHFASPSLLPSQLETLEPPVDALSIDVRESPDVIVDLIVNRLADSLQ